MKLSPLRHVMEVLGVTAFLLVIIFINNNPTSAQTATCPAGTQPATAADLTAMKDGGIPNPVTGECWSPSSAVVGQTADAAKQDLLQNYNATQSSEPNNTGITNLNATFAIHLDNMLKAATAAGYNIKVISGWRDSQHNMEVGGATNSMHLKGLAADLQYPGTSGVQASPTSSFHTCEQSSGGVASYQWVASHDVQFGMATLMQIFHKSYSGECNHLQDTTGVSGVTAAPVLPTSPAPKPGAQIAQDLNQALNPGSSSGSAGAGTTPTSGVSSNGGVAAGSTAGTNGQCSIGMINLGGSCVPMSMMQSLLSPQQSSIPPIPPPPPASQTPASSQTSAQAQSAPSVLQTPTSAQQTTVSTGNITGNVTAASTSASALLLALENPQSGTQTSTQGTATSVPPVVLNPNTQAVQQLTPTSPPPTPIGSAPAQNNASLGQVVTEQPGAAPTTQGAPGNTFTSGNLTATQNGYSAPQSTFSSALAVLQNLQGELINALQYLKPFNGNVPTSGE